MTILLTFVHVVVCFFLIVVVLLQSGKAADLAGAFGGMGSQTTFGPRGSATVLSKATTIAAALFMVTSLGLTILTSRATASTGSVLEKNKPAPAKNVPAKPLTPAAPITGLPPNVQITPGTTQTVNIGGKQVQITTGQPTPSAKPANAAPAPAQSKPAPAPDKK
ncbi:MAG TPA: preprotein translocase subunit SecG [Bryobacteraceae bacterium]|nr:preprotein translocase subunit SecG [Bryobacteraceae bacterium]